MSTYSKRILAGALSLALCLSPAALAAKTEEPPLVAAVEGLSPLLYEPDPAAGYRAALAELGRQEEVGHVTDFVQIAALGVMATPALLVAGKVLCAGRVLNKDEAKALLQQA